MGILIDKVRETYHRNDYTLVIVPDADHGLLQTATGLIAETRGRRDSIFAPEVMDLQTDWVLDRFGGRQITEKDTQRTANNGLE